MTLTQSRPSTKFAASHSHAQKAPHTPRRCRVVRVQDVTTSIANRRLAANEPIVAAAGNASLAYRTLTRAADIVGATIGILLLSPIMLTTYIVLMITTRGQAIFSQERIGHLGKRFKMYKFRTMHLNAELMQTNVENEKDGPIFKNRRDPRITRIGRILRRLSIDEMPQLFNVLAGHMALVGPRPPVAKEVVYYKSWQRQRLAVRPGLTCLWQVSGRSEVGFEDWVRMDIWYVKNQSLWTDLVLLVKTPLAVLSCRGAF